MGMKALKINNIQTWLHKETRTGINVRYTPSFDNKTMELVISYLIGATVNSYKNVTCEEVIFLNLWILNLKIQGPFQDKIKSKNISRISRISRTSAAHLSTSNFTHLQEITFFLIGWTLVERWSNPTVARFFERQQQNSTKRKNGDPHRRVTGKCGHVTEKHCRTDYQ